MSSSPNLAAFAHHAFLPRLFLLAYMFLSLSATLMSLHLFKPFPLPGFLYEALQSQMGASHVLSDHGPHCAVLDVSDHPVSPTKL